MSDMSESKLIPIIIPSYEPNEQLIRLLSELNNNNQGPVILVNDGNSSEYSDYFDKAKSTYNATVLTHEVNKGKGAALKTAFTYCLSNYPDMTGCVTADSDGQHSPKDIQIICDKLSEFPDSLILGVRDFDLEMIPDKSRFGNNTTRKVFRFLYKKDISDTQTGLRGIPKALAEKYLDVSGDRFEFEMRTLIYTVEHNVPITEIPIETIYDSKENHSTHFHPIKDSVRIFSSFGATFGKFVVSALSSSVIDIALFQLLCNLLKSSADSVRYVAYAGIIARIVSATFNYLVNFNIVFKSSKNHKKSVAGYILLAAVQMALSTSLTTLLVAAVSPTAEAFVKIPVDILLFFISYIVQKKVIF